MKITMFSPMLDQIVTAHTASSARRGSPSQSIWGIPRVRLMKSESTPSGRRICCQMRAMATVLVTTGVKNSTM